MDIQDERDRLRQRVDVLAVVIATGKWSDGVVNDEPVFALLAYETALEMLRWNEPITVEEWRETVTKRFAERDPRGGKR
jgi:hypothetical protein